MTELIGQLFGNYQLEALLATGPTGQTFSGRHLRLGRQAAIRLFTADLLARPGVQPRLLAALSDAAALRHPHIATVYDVGDQDGRLFVAADLLPGGSLRVLLQADIRESVPLATRLELVAQAAEGLAAAHGRGIVHGAVRPETLWLERRLDQGPPALKLVDLGVAAVLPEESLGAPAYLSPEQCRGQVIDGRSDLYSLGVVLYELLVGVPPFNVLTVEAALEKHLRTRPVPPRLVRSEIPAEVEAIVLRCLAKGPAERYPDAAALAADVRRVIATLMPAPPAAVPEPPALPLAEQPTVPIPTPPLPLAEQPTVPASLPPAGDDLLTGLLGGAAAAPALGGAPRARIELLPEQEQLALTPGAPAVIPLRLANTGGATDEITLAVEGVPGAWLRETGQLAFRLDPGAQTSTAILVTVPRGPEALAGDYTVVVRARSRSGVEAGSARMRWTVLPFGSTELRITPPRAESRDVASYQLLLWNHGNRPASYFLTFEDADDSLGYALEQDEVSLEPGQSARLSLTVEGAGRLAGAPLARRFAIRAEAGRDEVATAEAEFVHLATLPPWAPLAALAALALLLLAGAWALLGDGGGGVAGVPTATATLLPPTLTPLPTPLPGAPLVQRFTAEPSVVAPGQTVLLTWQVEGAERVFVDQLGDVGSSGQANYRPEQTTDFTLRAIAPGGKETIVIARVTVAPPTATPTLEPSPTTAPTVTATAVPPTVTASVVPPTLTATAVPPTVTATAVPPAGGATLDLVALAPEATWRTAEGRVSFGRPLLRADQGGWAARADATLEDGQPYEDLLEMVPPAVTAAQPLSPTAELYIEGEYQIPTLQQGQILVGALGFAQGATGEGVTVTITFAGQPIYQASKVPDGRLLPISVDLSPFGGQAGPLALRVTGRSAPSAEGLFWVRPRIDVPR